MLKFLSTRNNTSWVELLFWIFGLSYLAFVNPDSAQFSLCPLKNLGFEYCPGCGLGHSISYIFHGNLAASFSSHPLGLFALPVIGSRIVTLMKPLFHSTH